MSISGISSSATSGTSSSQMEAQKTLQQRAQDGDPVAIAELDQEKELEQPSKSGASEPGKGAVVDTYV